jgi:hypothetical protein
MSDTQNKYIKIILFITVLLAIAAVLAALVVFKMQPRFNADNEQATLEADITGNDFAPHKALYEVKLSETKNGSQIVNISGQMMYEWQRTCDSWLSDHRFNMLYEYADSPSLRLVSNFSTFEAVDGSSLDFSSQRKNNGEIFEEIRGFAEGTNATYRLPEEHVMDLPEGTLFPIAHTVQVAKQVREGRKFYNAIIFDGSDTDGPVEVSSFIGKPANPLSLYQDIEEIDLSLIQSPAHNVRLAFFPIGQEKDQGASDYEMDLIFHENGVISDMTVEYDAFTVTQKLVALEKVESQCEQ